MVLILASIVYSAMIVGARKRKYKSDGRSKRGPTEAGCRASVARTEHANIDLVGETSNDQCT
jgi:hypothetical protein